MRSNKRANRSTKRGGSVNALKRSSQRSSTSSALSVSHLSNSLPSSPASRQLSHVSSASSPSIVRGIMSSSNGKVRSSHTASRRKISILSSSSRFSPIDLPTQMRRKMPHASTSTARVKHIDTSRKHSFAPVYTVESKRGISTNTIIRQRPGKQEHPLAGMKFSTSVSSNESEREGSDGDNDNDDDQSGITQLRKGPIMPEIARLVEVRNTAQPAPYYTGRLDELPLISQRMVDNDGIFARSSPPLLQLASVSHPELRLDSRVMYMKHGDIDLFVLPITQPDDTLLNHSAIEYMVDALSPESMVVPLSKKPRNLEDLQTIFTTEVTSEQLKYDLFNPEMDPPEITAGNLSAIESSQFAARLAYDRGVDINLSGRLETVSFDNWKYKQFQSKEPASKMVTLKLRPQTTNNALVDNLLLTVLPHTPHMNTLTEITMVFEPALVATASIRSALEEQQRLHDLEGEGAGPRRVVALLDTAHLRHFENTFDLVNLLDENDFIYLKQGYDAYLANNQLETPRAFLEENGGIPKNALEFPVIVSRALDNDNATKPFSNIHLLFTSIYGPVASVTGGNVCGKCEMTFDHMNLYKANCRHPKIINRGLCSRPFTWGSIPEFLRFPPFGPEAKNGLFTKWMKLRHFLADCEQKGIEVDNSVNPDLSEDEAPSGSDNDGEQGDSGDHEISRSAKAVRSRYNEFRRATDHLSSKLKAGQQSLSGDDEYAQLMREKEQMKRELEQLRKEKEKYDVTRTSAKATGDDEHGSFDSSFKSKKQTDSSKSDKTKHDGDDSDDESKKPPSSSSSSQGGDDQSSSSSSSSSSSTKSFKHADINLITVNPSIFSASKMTASSHITKHNTHPQHTSRRGFSFNPLSSLTALLGGGSTTPSTGNGPVTQMEIMGLMMKFMKNLQSGQQLSEADHREIQSVLERLEKHNDKQVPPQTKQLLQKLKNGEFVSPEELAKMTGISMETLGEIVKITQDFKAGKMNQMAFMGELMKFAQKIQPPGGQKM